MSLVVPSWFKQRQGKAEPVDDFTYKVTAPNLGPAFVSIRPDGAGQFAAAVRRASDGPDLAATSPQFTSTYDAWEAAFELFRRQLVV